MLFHTFSSKEERRAYGGSAFIEIQFCTLPIGTKRKRILRKVDHWKNDSLYIYIDDIDQFSLYYSSVFDYGAYSNQNKRPVDIFGINYYAPFLIDAIVEKLRLKTPPDYEALVDWLNKAKAYNGFYILGI